MVLFELRHIFAADPVKPCVLVARVLVENMATFGNQIFHQVCANNKKNKRRHLFLLLQHLVFFCTCDK